MLRSRIPELDREQIREAHESVTMLASGVGPIECAMPTGAHPVDATAILLRFRGIYGDAQVDAVIATKEESAHAV